MYSLVKIPEPINKHIRVYYYEHAQLHSPVINAATNGKIWEKKLFNIYKDLIQPNYTIVDVGAFIGSHTLIFSILANQGKVIAFEPCSKPFEALTKSIEQNRLKNITLYKNVVSDKNNVEETMGSTYDGDSALIHCRPERS